MSAPNTARLLLRDFEFPQLLGARCESGEIPPDDFYSDRKRETRKRARVKEFCQPCPVKNQCLQWALEHREKWGIWGGMEPRERHKLLKQKTR